MGELFQKKPPKVAAPLSKPKSAAETTADTGNSKLADTINADIQKALGRVKVSHGAQEMEVDVAGKSIAYVRDNLSGVMQIPKDAEAWLNNAKMTDEMTLLDANAKLEFIKASGVKGS